VSACLRVRMRVCKSCVGVCMCVCACGCAVCVDASESECVSV